MYFLVVFHSKNCAVHSGNPTVSSVYLPTPRWHHIKALNLQKWIKDEHRTIYSFSNTTSYFTFYTFFSSFRITLWPMWLANSTRQPCFYPPQTHAQEDKQNWQRKLDEPDGKPVLCQRTFSSVCRAGFLHSPTAQFYPLKTKRNLLYIRNQSVPRCKHFPPRL
jgi:hypothetical protein